jgi:hypothetical protein
VANLVRDRELLEAAKREAGAVLAGPNAEISRPEMDRALVRWRTCVPAAGFLTDWWKSARAYASAMAPAR